MKLYKKDYYTLTFFRKIVEFSVLPKMAQSAKKQKDITFLWVFIALGMYNFGNMLNVNAQGSFCLLKQILFLVKVKVIGVR